MSDPQKIYDDFIRKSEITVSETVEREKYEERVLSDARKAALIGVARLSRRFPLSDETLRIYRLRCFLEYDEVKEILEGRFFWKYTAPAGSKAMCEQVSFSMDYSEIFRLAEGK